MAMIVLVAVLLGVTEASAQICLGRAPIGTKSSVPVGVERSM
jgi:hypothetical protein